MGSTISMESKFDMFVSFVVEFVFTTILLCVIFANLSFGSSFRNGISFNQNFTAGPILTGITIMILVYLATLLYTLTGISTGHMFPLITIPAMTNKGLGILSVSTVKGFLLLIAQFLAMIAAWYIIEPKMP